MEKKLVLLDRKDQSIIVSYNGYIPEVYQRINESHSRSLILSNKIKANTLEIVNDEISEYLFIFENNKYSIDDNLKVFLGGRRVLENTQFEPKAFQIEDAELMYKAKKILNASECGTGKTATAILATLKIGYGRSLVCAPSSLLHVWEQEILKISPNSKIRVVSSQNDYKKIDDSEWIIVSYGRLKDFLDIKFTTFIIDEAHLIKACDWGKPSSQRAEYALYIAHKTEYVYALTATPMPNYVLDIYNILVAINATDVTFNNNFVQFADEYIKPRKKLIGRNKSIWDMTGCYNHKRLNNQLKHYMIRRIRTEVLPSIAKMRQIIPIIIKEPLNVKLTPETYSADLMRVRKEVAMAKVSGTIDLINIFLQQKEKVVVFTCFLDVVHIIAGKFQKAVVIEGAMTSQERYQSVMAFQHGDADVCVVSLLAGGTGITLHSSHTVIFCDFDYVPSDLLQAEDRVARIGQKENICNIYYITARNNNVDYTAAKIIERKLTNINQIVDGDIKEELFAELFQKEKGESGSYKQ